jgi:hypothetical protein
MTKGSAALWLLAAGCLSACHGSDAAGASCAPVSSGESWPIDPTALTPQPWPAGKAFMPTNHGPLPLVANAGNGQLNPLRLVTVVTQGDPLHDALHAFGDALATSQWLATVGKDYGMAPTATSLHLDGPAMTGTVSPSDMASYVGNLAGSIPADGRTLFLLYLPPGVNEVENGEINCNCSALGGAHGRYDASGDGLAWVQRCTSTDDDFMTRVASHEVAEAMTDTGKGYRLQQPSPPWSGTPWASLQQGDIEIGDLCTSTYVTEGEWTYQRIWSNSAAQAGGDPCVPALKTPYFDTSSGVDWTEIAPGETKQVPFNGWSTGPRPDWYVYASVASSAFTATVTTSRQQTLDGVTYSAINDGDTGTLTVTASTSLHSGDYAIVRLASRSADRVDGVHYWPVGFHVP